MKMLDGKNVIITGTSRGVGKKMVEIFSENGANVIAHARTETIEHKEFCANTALKNDTTIWPLYFDITDYNAIKEGVQLIRSLKFSIDGLVNNAGTIFNALFQMTSLENLKIQFEANFFGPYIFTQYISKFMVKNKKGSIVNISSTSATDGYSGKSAYGASKAALITMTLSIAEELGKDGIRANAICPGLVNTDMALTMHDYIVKIQKESSYLNKIAEPKDIANTAMFLISDYSSYITGQVLRVDGGGTQQYAKV